MTSHEETWTVVERDGLLPTWRNAEGTRLLWVTVGGRPIHSTGRPIGTVLRIVTRVEIVEPG